MVETGDVPVVADPEAAKRIEVRQKTNLLVSGKIDSVVKEKLYESPEKLFSWAKDVFDEAKSIDSSFSSIFLSVVIFDKVAGLKTGESGRMLRA